jgi:hypothetical protein
VTDKTLRAILAVMLTAMFLAFAAAGIVLGWNHWWSIAAFVIAVFIVNGA